MAERFNVAGMIRSLHAGTFRSHKSPELSVVLGHEAKTSNGATGGRQVRVPLSALFQRAPLTVGPGSASAGALVGTTLGTYAPALQNRSLVFRLGAQLLPADGANVTIPRGVTVTTATYQGGELAPAVESETQFSKVTSTPKYLTLFSQVSRQLLLQSNADSILRLELTNSAAAAIDAGVLAGTGVAGQPTGILNTPGIALTTGTVSYASIVSGQQAVSDANAILDPSAVGYLATPAIAGLLKQRYRIATYGDTPLWQGPLAGGNIEGVPAFATKNMPASTLLYGDFSSIQVFMWDDAIVEADEITAFKSGMVGVRLLIPFDVVLRFPASFAVATGVT